MADLTTLLERVCSANRRLPELGLVVMHSGNVSACCRERDLVLIKPSGVDYGSLEPDDVSQVRLSDGQHLEGKRPSVDLPHHLYLYRNVAEIGSVVHTHSNFATAFAALGETIPAFLTAIADEFGGPIPCAPYADNEGSHIGEAILAHRTQSPAILLAHHGVFAWGDSPEAALKAAAMTEDVAKTVFYALQMGSPSELSSEEIAKWRHRYLHGYGQAIELG